ncbi:reverse transcriptase zinc-binding domain-containing protein [Tanacetum coccineum]
MASLQLENAHLKQTYKDLFESVQRSKVEIKQCDEVKVKDDFDEIETKNIELEYRVASLIKENEHLKLTYKNLFDSIKKSRAQTKTSNVTQDEAENLKSQLFEFAETKFKNILGKIKFFKKKQLDISDLNKGSGENVCDNAKCEFQTKFVELEKGQPQQQLPLPVSAPIVGIPQPQQQLPPVIAPIAEIPAQIQIPVDDDLMLDDVDAEMDPDSVKALTAQLDVEAAVTELNVLCTDSDKKLWVKDNGRDVLILREYISRFPPSFTINISTFEASRDTRAYHMMDYKELAAILMESNWSALFPFVIANEETIKVFPFFDPSEGSFNLIHKEFRLTTAGVAKRIVNTLRACQQVRERALLLVEVTYEREEVEHGRESNCHRFASGCLIEEDLNNGGSRVTWVENMGLSEITRGGMGFGATLMQDLLERSCERRRYSTEQGTCILELYALTQVIRAF